MKYSNWIVLPMLASGIFGLLGSIQTATSQNLSGRVTDTSGAPLVGASVSVPSLQRGTIADVDGRYRIERLPSDTLSVAFSFVGFERISRTVDLRRGDVSLDVVLREIVSTLGEVIVTEDRQRAALTRSTQSVGVIESDELNRTRGQTLGETIDALPGVTTLSTGPSIHKPVIRGLHSDRVIVVNGGVPQEGQQWGAEHAPEIDPFAGARIEVVRGAAGVEYGSGAIGGVVRIEDESLPYAHGFGGKVSLNGFSNSRQVAGSAELEGSSRALPGVGFRVQGSMRRAGDAATPDYVLGNTAFFERSGEVAIGYQNQSLELEGHASYFGTDLGVYRGSHFNTFASLDTVLALGHPPVDYSFSYEIDAPKQSIAHKVFALRARYLLAGGARAELQYGYQHNHRQEFDADRIGGRDPLARPAFDLALASQTLDGKLQSSPRDVLGGGVFGVIGVSGATQGNRSEVGYLIPNFRSYTGGAFARATYERSPVTLELGARVDHRRLRAFPREAGGRGDFVETNRDWTGLSGVAGVTWSFASAWSLSSNLLAAWRAPSTNELFSYGIHHGTAQFEIGAPDLDSERSTGVDATMRHFTSRVQFELSAYATGISDYIYLNPTGEIVVTVRGVFPEFEHAQTDALLTGMDAGFEYDLGSGFSFGTTASAVRGSTMDGGTPLLAMPADRLGLTAAYHLPDMKLLRDSEIELGSTHVRRQDRYPTRINDEGEVVPIDYLPPPPGYSLLQARFSGNLVVNTTEFQLSIAIENLLDTPYRDYLSRYRYFAHDLGRNVIVRLHVPLGAH